jgi:hypothetical protein
MTVRADQKINMRKKITEISIYTVLVHKLRFFSVYEFHKILIQRSQNLVRQSQTYTNLPQHSFPEGYECNIYYTLLAGVEYLSKTYHCYKYLTSSRSVFQNIKCFLFSYPDFPQKHEVYKGFLQGIHVNICSKLFISLPIVPSEPDGATYR